MYKFVPGSSLPAKTPELEEYFKWAADKGVRLNNAEYPCLFPPGYYGIVATAPFEPYTTLISVPNDLLLTSRVAETSELGDLFRKYDHVFNKNDLNYERLVLISFLIWEKFKGQKSEWFHVIRNQCTSFDLLQDWTVEELQMLQDSEVIFDTNQRINELVKIHQAWREVMLESQVFTSDMADYKEFLWAHRLMTTRTFEKFCPYLTIAPIAEFINHHNTSTNYYYGTNEASAESAKRYPNFDVGQEHDDDMIFEKPVRNVSWKQAVSIVLQSKVNQNTAFLKLIQEAEANDSQENKNCNLDYGRPDPEALRESSEKSLSLITGNEYYESGSQLFLTYGRHSNWMLLHNYGLTLENNIYDYARVVVSMDSLCPEENSSQVKELDNENVYLFKIKQETLCKDLLKLTRVLNWNESFDISACFSPVDASLELKAISKVIKLLTERLSSFPTTLEEDQELLQQKLPLRSYFAVFST